MPFVNIRLTQENNTAEQKAALIRGVTDLMATVLGKNPATTFVIIDEVATDNWGIAGQSVTERRAAPACLPRIQPEQAAITGTEHHTDQATPLDALIGFYAAFNQRNLTAMKEVWAAGAEPSMDNPLGGIRRGWEEIEQGYRRLFEGASQVYVEFHDYTIQTLGDVAIAVGRERGTCTTPDGTLTLAIRTSRVFQREGGRWRQWHHHGSVEDPALLARYQAVFRAGS